MTWSQVALPIQMHLIAALIALGIAVAQLVRVKGTVSHVWMGRLWVATMAVAVLSSFWIQELNDGSYSWIHLLSIFTLFSLGMAVWAARRRDVRAHAGWMIGTVVGALLVAGGFAVFGEGRVIGRLLG